MNGETSGVSDQSSPTVSKGCLIAMAVVAGVGVAAAIAILSLYQLSSVSRKEMLQREMAHYAEEAEEVLLGNDEDNVVLMKQKLADYSATDFGETLSVENAVAMLVDNQSTKLARAAFAEAAHGHVVEWRLRVSEISKTSDDGILAELVIPYEIRSGNSSTGSYINVTARFSSDAYPELVSVRQNEWIEIRGKLKIAGRNLEILEPVLISDLR